MTLKMDQDIVSKPSNNLLEGLLPGLKTSPHEETSYYDFNGTLKNESISGSSVDEDESQTYQNLNGNGSHDSRDHSTDDENTDVNFEKVISNTGDHKTSRKLSQKYVLENADTTSLMEALSWEDSGYSKHALQYMDVFRKSKKFCDLILKVGGSEIYCHKMIVAGVSKAVYREIMQGEQDSGPIARITVGNQNSALNTEAVELLIDYMYTSKLTIPSGLLTAVYKASVALDMDRIIPFCRKEIVNAFDVSKCISMRRLAQNTKDVELRNVIDKFIVDKFDEVSTTNEFLMLPRIKMELTAGNAAPCPIIPRENELCSLVLLWIREQIAKHGGHYIEDLTEQVQRITLEDLHNLNNRQVTNGHHHHTGPNGKIGCRMSRSSSMNSLNSDTSSDSTDQCQPDGVWSVLSFRQNAAHLVLLCCLGDVMATASVHLLAYNQNGVLSSASSSTHSCASSVGSVGEIAHLSQARCAAGIVAVNGKIFVLGGFNQSDCLDSVECFDPSTNRWHNVTRMPERRARFGAAVVNGQIYAVGGSTGSHDHCSMNYYNISDNKWFKSPNMPTHLSGAAIAVIGDTIYSVGGVQQKSGIAAISACYSYKLSVNKWTKAATLNTGRSYASVAVLNGVLYCAGGSDGWQSLNSVEKLENGEWTGAAPLNTARKGAGMSNHNGVLYCAGGSNSSTFLQSVETYNVEQDMWLLLNSGLTIPRTNVGLISVNSTLFAIGGYSGRNFLNSIEVFDETTETWSTSSDQANVRDTNGSTNFGSEVTLKALEEKFTISD